MDQYGYYMTFLLIMRIARFWRVVVFWRTVFPALPQDRIPYDIWGCIREKYSLWSILTGRIFFTCFIENNAREILLFTLAVWCFHVKFSSKQIPRNFVEFATQSLPIRSRETPSITIFLFSTAPFLDWGLKIMYLVFLAFRDNLFAQNHMYKELISLFASSYKDPMSELDTNRVVSSAKDNIFELHDYIWSLTLCWHTPTSHVQYPTVWHCVVEITAIDAVQQLYSWIYCQHIA